MKGKCIRQNLSIWQLVITAVVMLASYASSNGLRTEQNELKQPKNIIILFADGVAGSQFEVARYASQHLRNQPFTITDTFLKNSNLSLLTNFASDTFITDSAAAGTAMSTGFKITVSQVAVIPDGQPVKMVMEAAKAKGKRIGFMSTDAVYGATPASFSIHALKRGDSQDFSMDMQKTMQTLMASEPVRKALAFFEKDAANTLKQQLELVQIPAFSNQEKERAKYFQKLMEADGFKTEMDEVWNVFTTIPGTGDGPTVLISAHLDTVFPPETPLNIRYEGSKIYCPGISDDTRGLAEILTIMRGIREAGIRPVGNIIIGGNVGEEGLGNSRGMRHIFGKPNNIDGFISLEAAAKFLIHTIAGIYRYKVTFRGPGGHAMANFGMPNPIHAMGRALSGISDIQVPTEPWTTFNVGVVNGGTSVNSIAAECSITFEIRSVSQDVLDEVLQKIIAFSRQAVNMENSRWDHKPETDVTVEIEQLGIKPAGSQPLDSPIVQAARASFQVMNETLEYPEVGTGDSCIPLSKGIPAVVVGSGGSMGGGHNLSEWFDPTDAYKGAYRNLLLLLSLVGLEGISAPTLPILEK